MRILIVEDDPLTALVLQQTVVDLGFEALVAFSVSDAVAWLTGVGIHGAVLDIGLPDGQTYALARALKAEQLPFFFATGQDVDGNASFADVDVVSKPFDRNRLKRAICDLARKAQPSLQRTLPPLPVAPSLGPL